jgi:hypothetical protein
LFISISGLFEGVLNENKDCDIVMGHPMLDREESDSYKIKIKLNTLSAFSNPERIMATVSQLVYEIFRHLMKLPKLFSTFSTFPNLSLM